MAIPCPGDHRIGYVRIAKFGDKTLDEFTDVLAELNSAGIEGAHSRCP